MSNDQLSMSMAILRSWAAAVHAKLDAESIYLFGSSIFDSGRRFLSENSDVDLVIAMPPSHHTADQRFSWLKELQIQIEDLEEKLLRSLKRKHADRPICSALVLTRIEIDADIHKSNVKGFFSRNVFRNLLQEVPDGPLGGAGSLRCDNPNFAAAIAFTQKIRNMYVSTAPNGSRMLADWRGSDPIPKEAARATAGVAPLKGPAVAGGEFDIRLGIEHLSHWLYENRARDNVYYRLYDWLAARRDQRSAEDSPDLLSPDQYMLLAEIVHDIACEYLDISPLQDLGILDQAAQVAEQATEARAKGSRIELRPMFVISDKERLSGRVEEIEVAIEEATFNMKEKYEPPFEIAFSEAFSLAEAIAANESRGDINSRRLVVRAAERQKLLAIRAIDLYAGFRFLIFYQNLLFPSKTRQRDLRISLGSFAGTLQYGGPQRGMMVGWNQLENRRIAVRFSLGPEELGHYLNQQGLDGPLDLAANNQPLNTLDAAIRARFFIPTVVYQYVIEKSNKTPCVSQEEMDIFSIDAWHLGIA